MVSHPPWNGLVGPHSLAEDHMADVRRASTGFMLRLCFFRTSNNLSKDPRMYRMGSIHLAHSYCSPCQSSTQSSLWCHLPGVSGTSFLTFYPLPGPGTKKVASSSFHKTMCCDRAAIPSTITVYALYRAHQVPPGCVITSSWDALETLTQPSPSLHGQAGLLRLHPPCATLMRGLKGPHSL